MVGAYSFRLPYLYNLLAILAGNFLFAPSAMASDITCGARKRFTQKGEVFTPMHFLTHFDSLYALVRLQFLQVASFSLNDPIALFRPLVQRKPL